MTRRPLRGFTGLALGAGALLLSCQSTDDPTPVNSPPSATIMTPTVGSLFSGGETISFSGTGTDAEDGSLPAADFTWWADLHHAAHTHPFMPVTTGATSGSFLVPPRGHPEDDIFLRIYLVVVDREGLPDTTYVDVQPRKVTLSFVSAPSGLTLTLEGQPRASPFSLTGVVGMERDLGAPTPQVVGPDSLVWVSWSDAGAALHTVVTPSTNTTYTATYQVVAVVNQHPTVNITAPAAGASIVQNTPTTVSANAADPDGSVVSVQFFDGAASIGTDNTAPYSVIWTPAVTGPHILTARATDNGTATTTSAAVAVTVTAAGGDGTPPTVQLTNPTDGTRNLSGAVSIAANASDNVGVVGVAFQVDGVALSEDLTAPYQATLPSTNPFTLGVHVFRARARDAAGNLSAWSASRVTFDNTTELPAGFSRTAYVTGLTGLATTMTFAPDGRLFIAQQNGALRVVTSAGALLPTPFVTVSTTATGERGLLGVALHPQFATNGWVYLYYTSSSGGPHNRIVRYTASGNVAGSAELVLVDLPPLSTATNHNGGAMHFGPDGKLYVAVGDNADSPNAQSMTIPFGKMLRFNDDGTIPTDNPFYGSTTGLNRSIWALGLRNPFTFGFQPGTGRMFINDVGQGDWEEIDNGTAGANYGWPFFEGYGGAPTYVEPIYSYGHSSASNPSLVIGFSIVGAAFYGPAATLFPAEYQGNYFFADYVNGWVNRLDTVNGNAVYAFWNGGQPITDLHVGPDGALYVLSNPGASWGVHRIGRP
jgi:glucose/arabinose dehydrogenase